MRDLKASKTTLKKSSRILTLWVLAQLQACSAQLQCSQNERIGESSGVIRNVPTHEIWDLSFWYLWQYEECLKDRLIGRQIIRTGRGDDFINLK